MEATNDDPPPAVPARLDPAVRRRWLLGAGAVAVAVAAVPAAWVASGRWRPADEGTAGTIAGPGGAPLVGREAPNFALLDPAGARVELKQFRGKPVVLNFWATWCAPCKEEMPAFEEVYRHYRDRGLVVLAVSADDASTAKLVPDYLREGGPGVGSYTFPVALDTKQEVVRAYKLLGLPGTFFVDKTGVIHALHQGAMSRQMIEDGLKTILAA